MLAVLYVAALIYFGDCICRSFFRAVTLRQRLAQAFLVGLLVSSIITYLGALAFYRTAQPLIWGNLVFLGVFILAARFLPRAVTTEYLTAPISRPAGREDWNLAFLAIYGAFGGWLLLTNLSYSDDSFWFAFKSWSDFGPNLSVAQSLVSGHNFPTEHPFFAGGHISYHFLFWFQAGNLSFLGLNLAASINLLSYLSLLALLTLIMTLAEILFNSYAVGRITAALFFFASSSLAYIPFLKTQASLSAAWDAMLNAQSFLPTGYPYRGEGWGALSVDIFINQRHLISGTGLLLMVVIFLADFYKYLLAQQETPPLPLPDATMPTTDPLYLPAVSIPESAAAQETPEDITFQTEQDTSETIVPQDEPDTPEDITPQTMQDTPEDITPQDEPELPPVAASEIPETEETLPDTNTPALLENQEQEAESVTPGPVTPLRTARQDLRENLRTFIFSGAIIGALPLWNSAVFVSALVLLGGIWLFFPYRLYLSCLLGTAFLLGLPQVLWLKSGPLMEAGPSLFHLGYTIENATVPLVFEYLAWTFGVKWLLLFLALWLLPRVHLRFGGAFMLLLVVVFTLQLSRDAFNNHKLINIWNIFALTYSAYAIWRIGRGRFPRKILAGALTLAMIAGAVIDLFPVLNDALLQVRYGNDRLVTWVVNETKQDAVFLSNPFLSHQILFAGRKLFLGNTLFAWTAGYNVGAREAVYQQMFTERNPAVLLKLLRENNISYVVLDDGIRGHHLVKDKGLNSQVYQAYFPVVFTDSEHLYDNLTIYKVPPP